MESYEVQLKDFKKAEQELTGKERVFISQDNNTRSTTIDEIRKPLAEQLNDNAQEIITVKKDYAKKTELQVTNINVSKNTIDIELQKVRIDNITKIEEGSTTGDIELQDIRVGIDGNTYANAGDSIRTQINRICSQQKINTFVLGMPDGTATGEGEDGLWGGRANSGIIKLKKGDIISFKSPYVGCIFYFNENHTDASKCQQINLVNDFFSEVTVECTGYCVIIAKHEDETGFNNTDFLNNNTILTSFSFNDIENNVIQKVNYLYGHNDRKTGIFNFTNNLITSDRFFELNGKDVSIISDTEFFLIIYDEKYNIMLDTFEPTQSYQSQYLFNIVAKYSNAKFIRIVAQADNGLNANTYIHSGVKKKDIKINVIVSASNSIQSNKDNSEFIGNGEDDREMLQQAMWLSYLRNSKTILCEGDYILNSLAPVDDGAPEKTCLWFNSVKNDFQYANNVKMFSLEGMTQGISYTSGTRIILGDSLYNFVNSTDLIDLIRGKYQNDFDVTKGVSAISMKYLTFILPMNDKAITCVDLGYSHACDLEDIKCIAVKPEDGYGHLKTPPIANEKCYGIRGLFGSNWNVVNTYKNIEVFGFYIGFDISGEHCSVINASAKYNYYGFTFCCLQRFGANHHPITCINMLDEHSVCMPMFSSSGSANNQTVHIFGYNLMFPSWCTQGDIPAEDERHNLAVEKGGLENGWGGVIYYTNNTTRDGHISSNQWYPRFFQNGGKAIRCINGAHKLAHSAIGRKQIEPNYLQEVFDITLNKKVIWDGEKWLDFNGNIVD